MLSLRPKLLIIIFITADVISSAMMAHGLLGNPTDRLFFIHLFGATILACFAIPSLEKNIDLKIFRNSLLVSIPSIVAMQLATSMISFDIFQAAYFQYTLFVILRLIAMRIVFYLYKYGKF